MACKLQIIQERLAEIANTPAGKALGNKIKIDEAIKAVSNYIPKIAVDNKQERIINKLNTANNKSWLGSTTTITTKAGIDLNDVNTITNERINKLFSTNIMLQQNTNQDYDEKIASTLANKLTNLYKGIESLYLDGQVEFRMMLNELSGGIAMFQLSNKRKQEFEAKLRKARPELDGTKIDDILKSIEEFSEKEAGKNEKLMKKLELLALHWILKGNVILPEDGSKILDALKIADKNKLDPFSYNNPNEIIESFAKVDDKAKPLNPDDYLGKGYSNKQEWAEGVTVYDVDNNDIGRKVSRAMIDTHFGEDANPWCLLAKQDDSIAGTATYWYNSYPGEKKIAFKDGKLIAFYGGNQWWDRMDKPTDGVAINVKNTKDKNGRTPIQQSIVYENNVQYNDIIKYTRGNVQNGLYEEWNSAGVKTVEDVYEKGKIKVKAYIDSKGKVINRTYVDTSIKEYLPETLKYKIKDVTGSVTVYEKENEKVTKIEVTNKSSRLTANLSIFDYGDGFIETEATAIVMAPLSGLEYYEEEYVQEGGMTYNVSENTLVDFINSFDTTNEYTEEDVKRLSIRTNTEELILGKTVYVSEEDIPFQKQDNIIKGAAVLSKKKILIDVQNRSTDTLAHEYAHFYIAVFRDTPIVQEAIKKWGGEEKLVQAIGEQAVKQKAEINRWWRRFSNWVKSLFTGLDKTDKEKLVEMLTDAFLTAKDLQTNKSEPGTMSLKDLVTRSNEIVEDIENCEG